MGTPARSPQRKENPKSVARSPAPLRLLAQSGAPSRPSHSAASPTARAVRLGVSDDVPLAPAHTDTTTAVASQPTNRPTAASPSPQRDVPSLTWSTSIATPTIGRADR